MPMVTKLLMVVTYPPLGAPILRMTWVTWGHVTNWKKYISTFSRLSPLNLASCWLEKWDSESKRLNRHRFNFLFLCQFTALLTVHSRFPYLWIFGNTLNWRILTTCVLRLLTVFSFGLCRIFISSSSLFTFIQFLY